MTQKRSKKKTFRGLKKNPPFFMDLMKREVDDVWVLGYDVEPTDSTRYFIYISATTGNGSL